MNRPSIKGPRLVALCLHGFLPLNWCWSSKKRDDSGASADDATDEEITHVITLGNPAVLEQFGQAGCAAGRRSE